VRRKLRWVRALLLAAVSGGVGVAAMLMLQVAWADALAPALHESAESGTYLASLVVVVGEAAGLLAAGGAAYLTASSTRWVRARDLPPALLLTAVANLLLWTLLPYAWLLYAYPGALAGLSYAQKLGAAARARGAFAVYALPSPVYVWILQQGTYALLFALMLRWLVPAKRR